MPDGEGKPAEIRSLEDRKYLTLEVCALNSAHILNILGPYLGIVGSRMTRYDVPHSVYGLGRDVAAMAIYLFVMYASGDPLSRFGLRKPVFPKDLMALAWATVGVFVLYGWSVFKMHEALQRAPVFYLNVSPGWLLALRFAGVGISEETMFRGYLLTRLEQLTGKTFVAILGQAMFFGCMHYYEGQRGILMTGAFGLWMGVVYSKYRTIWPLAVVHALLDFIVTYVYAG